MSKLLNLFILCLFLASCSSDPIIETEYYEGTNNIKTERKYYSKSKKDFEYITYYPNGQIDTKGQFVDSLREGDWEYWYEDGREETTISFTKGRYYYEKKDRKKPFVIIEDSLRIGDVYRFEIANLYFDERILFSSNVIPITRNGTTYIIPESGDSISTYYYQLENVDVDNHACKDKISQITGLSEKEMENMVLCKPHLVQLKTIPLYH